MRSTQLTSPRALRRGLVALALTLGVAAFDKPAAAQEFRLHLEPAVALWLDTPQSDRFGPGLYFAVRPGVSIGRFVDLQISYALLYTPAASGFAEDGSAHFLTMGLRLRPFASMMAPEDNLGGLFVDFDLGYVRTEKLDRLGFDIGMGYGFQVSPGFSLGVVARYGHIVQPDDIAGQDPNDGQFLTIGLDLGFGPAYSPPETIWRDEPRECPPTSAAPTCPDVACSDLDKDGICDDADRCPTIAGPVGSYGCPLNPCTGKPLIVRVQFPYDSSELPAPRDDAPQTMDPVLDAVARAVAQDPTCRVCIIGYASEEGSVPYNDALSKRRSSAVQGYMNARGLALPRIPSTGFGELCQLAPLKSLEANRRVEFRRIDEGASCPATCADQAR
jgi:hypothetical protein